MRHDVIRGTMRGLMLFPPLAVVWVLALFSWGTRGAILYCSAIVVASMLSFHLHDRSGQ